MDEFAGNYRFREQLELVEKSISKLKALLIDYHGFTPDVSSKVRFIEVLSDVYSELKSHLEVFSRIAGERLFSSSIDVEARSLLCTVESILDKLNMEVGIHGKASKCFQSWKLFSICIYE